MIRSNLSFLQNFFHLGFIQASNIVIQILLFPLIIRIIGIEKFGVVMVTNSAVLLAGIFVNYGTGLSGIKDVVIHKNDKIKLLSTLSTIYYTRLIVTTLLLFLLPILYFTHLNLVYILFALPILFAETINPVFYFSGTENLFIYNLMNLFAKLLTVLLIVLMIKSPDDAPLVNFYIGISNCIFFAAIAIFTCIKKEIGVLKPNFTAIRDLLKQNFYLVGNNISVQLQQSFFLFTIASINQPLILGAYSICDKIVWSFRLILAAFSGALFPKAVDIFQTNQTGWRNFKRKINQLLAIIFTLNGIAFFIFAPLIAILFTGKSDPITISFIRTISFVPLVASLNVLNVLELLSRNKYRDIFTIAIAMLIITCLLSFIFITFFPEKYFGLYPLIIETCAIPLYLFFIRKKHQIIN
ncbi:MAG: oligosaccharide flippase family protein [Chitinophagaceae bacterium]|nr:oligosaccharide flippase family protein [Chitinophagaceae bacterium]